MDLERERGITIKSHAIQMEYMYKGEKYILNLIDTPGHVDFSYEVSRSIAACEGALLIVDAAQSIQAQTISNLYLALENDLEIIPVLNKIDLPSANPEEVKDDIVDLLGCSPDEIIPASGKTGLGVEAILEAIIERIPAPTGDPKAPLQALIFDSVYNSFRGVETYFRVMNGEIRKGQKIKFMSNGKTYDADEVGTLKLNQVPKPVISTGDVGYLITGTYPIEPLYNNHIPCLEPALYHGQVVGSVLKGHYGLLDGIVHHFVSKYLSLLLKYGYFGDYQRLIKGLRNENGSTVPVGKQAIRIREDSTDLDRASGGVYLTGNSL